MAFTRGTLCFATVRLKWKTAFHSPSLVHCLRNPPVLKFLFVSTPPKLKLLVYTTVSTRLMTRFKKENAVSNSIPPHGCITSCEKSGEVAEESKGRRSPQQNIILSERTEIRNARFDI